MLCIQGGAVENFLLCICDKNYNSQLAVDKVIAMIKRVSFLMDQV